MTNKEFVDILKNINKKILMDKEVIEIVGYINSQIVKIENETDIASDYIDELIKKMQ